MREAVAGCVGLLLFAVLFASCQNASTPPEAAADSVANEGLSVITDTSLLAGCYQMTLKEDTALLQISVVDSTVTGTLVYNFRQKDDNDGALKGVIINDHIYADYTFQSEGVTSVREVKFKIKDQALVPGFGDIIQKEGKIVFANPNELQFQYETPFLKVPCSKPIN